MAILTVAGVCKKRGDGEYGPWFVITEHITAGGKEFDKRYMCGGTKNGAAPQEGDYGVVTGYMREGVREHEGKHYAEIKVNGASWTTISESAAPAAPSEYNDEEVPF